MGLGVTLDAAIALVISIVATAALVSLRLVWSRVTRPPRRGIGFHERTGLAGNGRPSWTQVKHPHSLQF